MPGLSKNMARKVDYYEYWNKRRLEKRALLDRERKSLILLNPLLKDKKIFLDAGCGDGNFLVFLKSKFPEVDFFGADYSEMELESARRKNLFVQKVDFEKGADLKPSFFDIVYAGEVIEHLTLKLGGHFVLSTPNLCAWYNRILMVFGVQPLFLEPSTKSKLVGAGVLKKFKKEPQPVGHVRIFTFEALKDILKMHGFKIVKTGGAIFDEGFPRWIFPADRFFNLLPKMASHFVILCRKTEEIG
jgi:SAM-dependent methyltransferase